MSCGIPVVSTDAGDAAAIIREEEQVVPIQRPDLLSAAWCRVMDMQPGERDQVGSRERARIINHFDVARLAQRTVAQINSIK
jgi:glycosyltransferase involved in cell wall biosynthesis